MPATPDRRRRLEALAAQLGEAPATVAMTLRTELVRALAEIDAGLTGGDRERVGRATHAARNSVLMLDDRPMLDALRALDAAAGRDDGPSTRTARLRLDALWDRLAAELTQLAAPGER